MSRGRLLETTIFTVFLITASLLLSLLSYSKTDPGWSGTHTGYESAATLNLIGRYGAFVSDFLYSQFGWAAYLFLVPLSQALRVLFQLRLGRRQIESMDAMLIAISTTAAAFLFVCISAATLSFLLLPEGRMPQGSGGVVGQLLAGLMQDFGSVGRLVVTAMIFIISTHWSFHLSWLNLANWSWRGGKWLTVTAFQAVSYLPLVALDWMRQTQRKTAPQQRRRKLRELPPQTETAEVEVVAGGDAESPLVAGEEAEAPQPNIFSPPAAANSKAAANEAAAANIADETAVANQADEAIVAEAPVEAAAAKPAAQSSASPPPNTSPSQPSGRFAPPSWKLLHRADTGAQQISEDALAQRSEDLQRALAEYGIEAEVMEVSTGPVVTRFALQPRPGFQVAKLTRVSQDVARALSVASIRVVEVIEGKAYFGIEIPNPQRQSVMLSSVIAECEAQAAQMHLPAVLGAGISGEAVLADLASLPHLIVSGATGAGKSVSIHAILTSLLLHKDPVQLRLVMIDPKMLELAAYNNLPHLIAPVVTEMQQAKDALAWCCEEMERRYRLLAEARVRDLQSFNAVAGDEALPRLLVVIDELADLMMTSGKAIEQDIVRIAQKARAAGIHLLLATQRPSVDVITGLIKSNVPARIAFQVASSVDSRTILDQTGAEQLLGKGDMLFLQPGQGLPVRVHGAFVSEEEVEKIVAGWAGYEVAANYERLDSFPSGEPAVGSGPSEARADGSQDELYREAVDYVRSVGIGGRVSISSIQRHLVIGYNRAARIIEAMEAEQIVSPPNNQGIRSLLDKR